MEKMKDKLKKITAFVLFMGIIIFLFCKATWIFRANGEEAREDIVGFKNQANIDVVLYGGSNLLRFYQPLEAWKQKGYTSYNYATSAAKADLLKEYIEESRSTNEAQLYVCDIRTISMVESVVDEASLRNWSDSVPVFSPVRLKGIGSFLFSRDWQDQDIPSFYFDILKYHVNYEALGSSYQWAYTDLGNIYNVDKGFDPSLAHVPFEEPERYDGRGELTQQQEKGLNKLLDYCDQENLQVLFIVCPYIISESDWLILNTCGDIIQARGYEFVNFNEYYEEIGFDFETDFGDVNHVNYLGSQKYTAYLMDYISDHYDLADHRGEEAFDGWNSDYAIFAQSQEEWQESIDSLVAQHLEAKEIGAGLGDISDPERWYNKIQNRNFTVIIQKNESYDWPTDDATLKKMLSKWEMDMSKSSYVGVFSGNTCIFSSNEGETYYGNLGVDRGRGTKECTVSAGENPQMIIDGTDYYSEAEGIQIIVFDNNYQKIVDHAVLSVSGEEVRIIHQ